jgi:hypothetical protein
MDLKERIEALRHEIEASKGAARQEHLEHLEQAVMGLNGIGVEVPAWAKELVESVHEQDVEDGFDNMPV